MNDANTPSGNDRPAERTETVCTEDDLFVSGFVHRAQSLVPGEDAGRALPDKPRGLVLSLLPLNAEGRFTAPLYLPPFWRNSVRVQPYETLLWSFYADHALRWFERQAASPRTVRDLLRSHWGLARGYVAAGELDRALSVTRRMREALPRAVWPVPFLAFEMRLLTETGRAEAAIARPVGRSTEARLAHFSALCSHGSDPEAALEILNRIYRRHGLAQVQRVDLTRPLEIANLAAPAAPHPRSREASASVIMPVFNAVDTVRFAALSVLAQTWTNLELIIVDDASRDETWKVVSEIAEADDRVVPVRLGRNVGTYAAVNEGLRRATGRLATLHGADDWSHPQRLAIQVERFLSTGKANVTSGARVRSNMQFNQLLRYRHPLIKNVSSFLFEREKAQRLNGWDEVRFGADTEFAARYGRDAGCEHEHVARKVPLAFLLAEPRSLTLSQTTGLRSLAYGARREYIEAYTHWHASSDDLRRQAPPPFQVPRIALHADPKPLECGLLIVGDLADRRTERSALALIEDGLAAGRSIALWHLPALERIAQAVNTAVRSLAHLHRLPIIVPGEAVECEIAVVMDHGVCERLPAFLPHVRAAKACLFGYRMSDADALQRLSALLGVSVEPLEPPPRSL